jgi:tellurite resistance protein TehA-like permease
MMALQTAMISRFGGGEAFARTANALFGTFVCIVMLCICGHMLNRYRRRMQKGRSEAHA